MWFNFVYDEDKDYYDENDDDVVEVEEEEEEEDVYVSYNDFSLLDRVTAIFNI